MIADLFAKIVADPQLRLAFVAVAGPVLIGGWVGACAFLRGDL